MKKFKKGTLLVSKMIYFLSLISYNIYVNAEEQICQEGLSVKLPSNSFNSDGNIEANGLNYTRETYWKHENDTYFGCPCMVITCLRRCPNELDKNDSLPADILIEFTNITIWHNNENLQVNAHEHFHVFTGETCPKVTYELEPHNYKHDEYQILKNGTLLFPNSGHTAEANEYCILQDKSNEVKVVFCGESGEESQPPKSTEHYIYPVFMLFSVLFLIATLIAYVIAPEMKKVHGQSIACYSVSLMIGYLGLAMIQIVSEKISDATCSTIAFITYFFLLASFFWLHVMCFDIWWTFSGLKKMSGSLRQTGKKKIILYSIYAWTMPAILFTITLLLEFIFDIDQDLKPGFGLNRCWFQAKTPEFIYFNGPISIILAMNLFFFISTTINLVRLKKESAMLKRGDSRMHNNNDESEDKQRFKLYMKLFLIMGLSWTMEIISLIVEGPKEIWYITDIINTLQGVVIFVFCVWTTKVKESVIRRLFPRFGHSLSIHSIKSHTKSFDVSDSNDTPTTISMKKLQNSQNVNE